ERMQSVRQLGIGSEFEKMVQEWDGVFKAQPTENQAEDPQTTAVVVKSSDNLDWLGRLPAYLGSAAGSIGGGGLAIILVVFMLLKRRAAQSVHQARGASWTFLHDQGSRRSRPTHQPFLAHAGNRKRHFWLRASRWTISAGDSLCHPLGIAGRALAVRAIHRHLDRRVVPNHSQPRCLHRLVAATGDDWHISDIGTDYQ